jgi:hypothetical protein
MVEQIFTLCVQTSESYHNMELKILINAVLRNSTQKLTSCRKMTYTIADPRNALLCRSCFFVVYLFNNFLSTQLHRLGNTCNSGLWTGKDVHWSGRWVTKDNKTNPRSGLMASRTKIEPGISQLRNKSGNHAIADPNSVKGHAHLCASGALDNAIIYSPRSCIWMELVVGTQNYYAYKKRNFC